LFAFPFSALEPATHELPLPCARKLVHNIPSRLFHLFCLLEGGTVQRVASLSGAAHCSILSTPTNLRVNSRHRLKSKTFVQSADFLVDEVTVAKMCSAAANLMFPVPQRKSPCTSPDESPTLLQNASRCVKGSVQAEKVRRLHPYQLRALL
jgi:hypothetical protein